MNASLQEKMRALTMSYLKQLKERVAELKDVLSLCENNTLSNQSRERLRTQAHHLSGTGTTYGFPDISRYGQALEIKIIENPECEARLFVPDLLALIDACTSALKNAPEAPSATTPTRAPRSENTKTIICVDDDPAVLDVLKHVLEATELYHVLTYKSGQEAIAALDNISSTPHAILLDMLMPEMDGITLLRQLQKMPTVYDTPVAFLTRQTSSERLEEYLAIGAKGVIAKPIDVDALVYQIACLFGDAVPNHLSNT